MIKRITLVIFRHSSCCQKTDTPKVFWGYIVSIYSLSLTSQDKPIIFTWMNFSVTYLISSADVQNTAMMYWSDECHSSCSQSTDALLRSFTYCSFIKTINEMRKTTSLFQLRTVIWQPRDVETVYEKNIIDLEWL